MWLKSNLLKDLCADATSHSIPLELYINETSLHIWRASAKITIQDSLINWASEQNCFPKIIFQHGSSKNSHLALGSLFSIEEFPYIRTGKNPYGFMPKLYGGVGNKVVSGQLSIWKNFPRTFFFLPEIEIETVKGQSFIYLYFLNTKKFNKKGIVQKLSKLKENTHTKDSMAPTLIKRQDFPSRPEWNQAIESLLQSISLRKLEKAVLARQSSFAYQEPLSTSYFLQRLQTISNGTLFCIQFSPLTNFIGSTPELLYSRIENTLEVMALAGTASLPQIWHLQREKEQNEFGFVKGFVYETMKTLCRTIHSSFDITYPIASLVHLCRIYRGKLFPLIKDLEILTRLHPTPAISGFPRQIAAHYLEKIEGFDRGWYASPIGYISEKESRFYIAIRSALITENTLHLFSGAGIVQGSLAEKEWIELNKKIRHFVSVCEI